MVKKCLLLAMVYAGCIQPYTLHAQATASKPKLVIGIVVDQMRYDYLYRYQSKYGKGGFKRLLDQGYNVANCHYNYVPTYTGPGHASIYTGCAPAVHGIIANDWFDKTTHKYVYCAGDSTFQTVGAPGKAGQMAPTRMLSTTIGDELRIHTVKKSRVFGVALKDRGAILPAGHGANAAYWFDDASGKWISSSYYYNNGDAGLPVWLVETNNNAQKLFLYHLDQKWTTINDISTYTESTSDNNPYERPFTGETQPVFPHDLPALKNAAKHFGLIKATPFGNTVTRDFAKILIEQEKLGMGTQTDMLCLSFSSTDYVGHQFGPSSIETEDTYIRLDKDIEDLLNFLDTKIGKDQYLVFLTADHGAVEVPGYLKSFNVPGGYALDDEIKNNLDSVLAGIYGPVANNGHYVLSYSNQQVFLNMPLLQSRKTDISVVIKTAREYLMTLPVVANVYDENQMQNNSYLTGNVGLLLQNGFNAKRSGQLLVNYQPGVIEGDTRGTTHGSPYSYDTHVPLLFFGFGIKPGKSTSYTTITQIAPTVCSMLNIPFTNGSTPMVIDLK